MLFCNKRGGSDEILLTFVRNYFADDSDKTFIARQIQFCEKIRLVKSAARAGKSLGVNRVVNEFEIGWRNDFLTQQFVADSLRNRDKRCSVWQQRFVPAVHFKQDVPGQNEPRVCPAEPHRECGDRVVSRQMRVNDFDVFAFDKIG